MAHRFILLVALLPIVFSVTFAIKLPNLPSRSHRRPLCLRAEKLVCTFKSTTGNRVVGTLVFSNVLNPSYRPWHWGVRRCRVQVVGSIRGLTPGKHGLHIHSYGDERSATGSSFGPHFSNPWFIPLPHGLPNDRLRHWGDFGNFVANRRGVAPVRYVDRLVTLRGIVGRGMVIHGGEDKGAAFQPSGASGPRVGTCVIGFANPDQK